MLQSLTSSLPGSNKMYSSVNMDIFVVSDGEVPYDKSCFAPGIDRTDVDAVSKNTTDYISLTHNVLVFRRNNSIILIDAGNGKTSSGEGGHLISNLKAIGIEPDMVTDVVLTHAHPDHLGGLIDSNRQLAFPNASILISQEEYDFWQSDTPDFSKSKNTPQMLRDVQKNIQQMLVVIKDRLQFFHGTDLLFDFLQPIPAIGHTPGHYMFIVNTGNEKFVHMGDICHEELMLFNKPEWGTVFDIDFDLAVTIRVEVLNWFAASKELVFGYHMPWPGFGKVVKNRTGLKWEAKDSFEE